LLNYDKVGPNTYVKKDKPKQARAPKVPRFANQKTRRTVTANSTKPNLSDFDKQFEEIEKLELGGR